MWLQGVVRKKSGEEFVIVRLPMLAVAVLIIVGSASAYAACPPGSVPGVSNGQAVCFRATCQDQCAPLLEAVHPKSEAKRVYNNCVALCANKPGLSLTCPDGSRVSVKDAKLCGKS